MSNHPEPKNKEYAVEVIRVENLHDLEGCDNVVGLGVNGRQAVVGKNTQVGDIGLFFSTESQIADEFAHHNNLYRHGDKNADEGAKGYLEDNRRIRAQKFRGHVSNGLFMPLESLAYIKGFDPTTLEVGDLFDEIQGHEIVRKYVLKEPGVAKSKQQHEKRFRRVDQRHFPLHIDTDNWWRNERSIGENEQIIVTQKIHGTSVRFGRIVVSRELKWYERLAKKVGLRIQEKEFDNVYGSRRVTKDVNDPNHNHFYSKDVWSEVGKRFDSLIPENYVVYGEIIGWVSGEDGAAPTPIQKNYTYDQKPGEADLYVYRITVVNGQGIAIDLSWEQIVDFCKERGMKHVPVFYEGPKSGFDVDAFMDINYSTSGYKHAVPLEKARVDEGVVIRTRAAQPYFLKAKSPKFLEHETKMLDKGEVDLESVGSEPEEES